MPFCRITLSGRKPVPREKCTDVCRTWGDLIRVRRIGLTPNKRKLSVQLNVSDITIYLWERSRVKPSLAQIPKAIELLGRDPLKKKTENLGEKIRDTDRFTA